MHTIGLNYLLIEKFYDLEDFQNNPIFGDLFKKIFFSFCVAVHSCVDKRDLFFVPEKVDYNIYTQRTIYTM